MKRVCLLTGQPGTGKTSIIKEALSKVKIKAGGFYTEEIRTGGVRQGFRIITMEGQNAVLAHVNISTYCRVSKYGVDVQGLNEVGARAIYTAIDGSDLIVIDEIGKMELFSSEFKDAVLKAMNSGKKVLGTVMFAPNTFADQIKRHAEVEVITVTKANRDEVLRKVLKWLEIKEVNTDLK